jgi:hypothetical protein
MARAVAQKYYESREALGFPMVATGGLEAVDEAVEVVDE